MPRSSLGLALAGLLALARPATAQSGPDRDAFLRWAKGAIRPLRTVTMTGSDADLAPLARMIGTASVVAVSEGVHAGAEPLEFRNRLFRYLVEHLGFTAIAIESGLTEGRVVHDYVRDGRGDLPSVLARGLTWTFDRLPQNEALVRWLRQYNADPRHARKLDFFGFDVPGSPGNPAANRGMRTALDEVLAYLERVDPAAAAAFHSRLDSLLPDVRLDPANQDSRQYPRLSAAERDVLTGAVADLVALLERREARYTAASSPVDYQWAHRNVLGARAVDSWLRQIPIGWKPSAGMSFFLEATDIRDRAQADNVGWILDRLGPGAKLLIFASRYHISTTPVKTSLAAGGPGNAVAGTYLRRRLGSRLVTIGNLIGKGAFGCAGFSATIDPSPPESVDGTIGALGLPLALLDLRAAPPAARAWLDREQTLGGGRDAMRVVIGQAFDLVYYLDSVAPACPK
jgi:erythromycin esterase